MNRSIVVGLAVGTLATFVAVQPAKALSHLIQSPENHVVLRSAVVDDRDPSPPCGAYWDQEFVEVSPTGILSDTAFSVPKGSVLVVTDIDWSASEGPISFLPGDVLEFSIFLGEPKATVFRTGQLIGDYANAGVMVGSESLTAGFRVGPDTPICPLVLGVHNGGGGRLDADQIILRGYLIQDSRKATR